MSMRLLFAVQANEATIQTPIDDIESFLWLLIWGIVQASKDIEGAKDNNPGISRMLAAWSGDVTNNLTKPTCAETIWKDAVFGDLIQEWQDTLRVAQRENGKIAENMLEMVGNNPGWNNACNELEDYCKKIYKDILESGFRYLQGIGRYSNWNDVVTANIQRPNKRRRY